MTCENPKVRVLVVEDEWLIALTTQQLLEEAGYVVVGPAPSVRAALALIGNNVDVAMLDVRLGKDTSFPVAEALIRQNTPFLFMSGYDREDMPDNLNRHIMVAKPVLQAILLEKLSVLMTEAKA